MLYAAAPGAGAAAGDASAVRHDGAHRIIAFALETWNHNTLALARARCSHNTRGALPHLRLEGGPSRGPRAGGLARRETPRPCARLSPECRGLSRRCRGGVAAVALVSFSFFFSVTHSLRNDDSRRTREDRLGVWRVQRGCLAADAA